MFSNCEPPAILRPAMLAASLKGPSLYFRSLKLNRARMDLIQNTVRTATVTDVAMKWGFLHLGRFSVEYRKLFGESPKETLTH